MIQKGIVEEKCIKMYSPIFDTLSPFTFMKDLGLNRRRLKWRPSSCCKEVQLKTPPYFLVSGSQSAQRWVARESTVVIPTLCRVPGKWWLPSPTTCAQSYNIISWHINNWLKLIYNYNVKWMGSPGRDGGKNCLNMKLLYLYSGVTN